MLESYSVNITVPEGGIIPFNSPVLDKGCTAVQRGTGVIALNKCGVYRVTVSVSGSVTGAAAANIQIGLIKDGVLQPASVQEANSTAATDIVNITFSTLVQVSHNNSNCCCSQPVNIQVVNSGAEALFTHANITVDKIC